MADNFNLRTFLTENKLTKNSQLLNEGGESPKISTLGWKALEQSTDPEIKKLLVDYQASAAADYDKIDRDQGMMQQYAHVGDPRSDETIKMLQQLIALAGEKGIDLHPEAAPAKPEEEAKVLGFWDKVKAKVGLKEVSDPGFDTLMDVVDDEYDGDPAIAAAVEAAFNNGDIDTSEFGHDLNAPSRAVAQIANGMDIEAAQNAVERDLYESRLTAKERRLVEMVQRAMREEEIGPDGLPTRKADPGSPDFDPTDIPPPPKEIHTVVEEEDMVQEKPLPKYSSIEELMKEIEHGTNEAACKYKMEEMKRVYEALEAKVGSLEEGEHAEHIDQKAVKQMRKDIAALRKAEEKLRKEFEKKFTGKEKKETPKKEEAAQALQEGAFDLRKFLAENRK